ncbi:MAG: DUF3618 domain-containing protein [Bifidobacteriaceae bacterium]|jgi:hypothetical protein|nr:DUF3618 domain-containing protein [Bifidobacteriaceae bacterium]
MENQSSPAAIAARIAQRQAELAANVASLKDELNPASLAGRARNAIRREVHAVTHDDAGRLATPILAALAGAAVLVVGFIVLKAVKR